MWQASSVTVLSWHNGWNYLVYPGKFVNLSLVVKRLLELKGVQWLKEQLQYPQVLCILMAGHVWALWQALLDIQARSLSRLWYSSILCFLWSIVPIIPQKERANVLRCTPCQNWESCPMLEQSAATSDFERWWPMSMGAPKAAIMEQLS